MSIMKFRIWDKTNRRFLPEGEFALLPEGFVLVKRNSRLLVSFFWSTEMIEGYFIVQQFTRLKDKNDKDIYEGDIVSYTYVETGFGRPIPIWRRAGSVAIFRIVGGRFWSSMENLRP